MLGDFLAAIEYHLKLIKKVIFTDMQEKMIARLRELAPRGQREPGGGIHAT